MQLKVTRKITRIIKRCLYDCPYYETEGHTMMCGHRAAKKDPYIITYEAAYNGFPKECPLIKKEKKNEKKERIHAD